MKALTYRARSIMERSHRRCTSVRGSKKICPACKYESERGSTCIKQVGESVSSYALRQEKRWVARPVLHR